MSVSLFPSHPNRRRVPSIHLAPSPPLRNHPTQMTQHDLLLVSPGVTPDAGTQWALSFVECLAHFLTIPATPPPPPPPPPRDGGTCLTLPSIGRIIISTLAGDDFIFPIHIISFLGLQDENSSPRFPFFLSRFGFRIDGVGSFSSGLSATRYDLVLTLIGF